MTFLNKTFLLILFVTSSIFTSAMGASTTKYIPIISEDFINFIPQKVPQISSYIPPANSLEYTTIITTKGKKIRVDRTPDGFVFEGYVGKIVLLEVYGDTCPHCTAAIPSYNRLQAKYAKDVVVIALESYGTLSNASKQLYLTVAKDKHGSMFSFIPKVTSYRFQAVPYLMIMSRSGDIVYDKVLADFPESEIESQIQSLL